MERPPRSGLSRQKTRHALLAVPRKATTNHVEYAPTPIAWSTPWAPPSKSVDVENIVHPDKRRLSAHAARLHGAFLRYAHKESKASMQVGKTGRVTVERQKLVANPTFRSQQFKTILKDAGLITPRLSVQRIDLIFTYACVHGPGGKTGNKDMHLETFVFATKGIATELQVPHEDVIAALELIERPAAAAAAAAPPSPTAQLQAQFGVFSSARGAEMGHIADGTSALARPSSPSKTLHAGAFVPTVAIDLSDPSPVRVSDVSNELLLAPPRVPESDGLTAAPSLRVRGPPNGSLAPRSWQPMRSRRGAGAARRYTASAEAAVAASATSAAEVAAAAAADAAAMQAVAMRLDASSAPPCRGDGGRGMAEADRRLAEAAA